MSKKHRFTNAHRSYLMGMLLCLLTPMAAFPKAWSHEGKSKLVGHGVNGQWAPDKWFKESLSPRIANYRIQATLDWSGKRLAGSVQITWRNAGHAPTADFPLHLYMNAFNGKQNPFKAQTSLFSRNQDFNGPNDLGYCRIMEATMEGQRLKGRSGADDTVYWITLPRMIATGETVKIDIAWETRFPRLVQRTGFEGDFLMAAQWFPKVGVYQGDTWRCLPHHTEAEFFADFGIYDVEISMPKGLLPAFTGACVPQAGPANQALDARQDPAIPLNCIYKVHAEDVHDFAWAVMPKLSWGYRKFQYRGVDIYFFQQGQNRANFPRQFEALKAAMRTSSEMMFPYPYPVLTVIDAPPYAKAADGMEYPTLFLASSTHFDPIGFRLVPEELTIHEFGHQYFQGIIASNETEEAWLDEGLVTWFTGRTMQEMGQTLFAGRRLHIGGEHLNWLDYWRSPSVDPLTRPSNTLRDRESYFITSYLKACLMLDQLEATLGRPTMDKAIRAYANEMAFQHPTAQDFKKILERVSNRDLDAFWRDFVQGTDTLDYVIRKVEDIMTFEGGWKLGEGIFQPITPSSQGARGRIELERRGGLRLPITLWVQLADRTEHRLHWDGQNRWTAFEFQSPINAAVLDPDGNYPMLKNRLHSQYARQTAKRGFHYWSQMLWATITGLFQSVGLA